LLHRKATLGRRKEGVQCRLVRAPPMDGSKDGQAGCTRKPYWGVVKKACDIDQYGAPPMDGLMDG
jgi:hypothetical protein